MVITQSKEGVCADELDCLAVQLRFFHLVWIIPLFETRGIQFKKEDIFQVILRWLPQMTRNFH